MSDLLTYLKNGCDVKTSLFLKKRGSCCKTSCLHCPYGFTLKKEGLQFEDLNLDNLEEARSLSLRGIPSEQIVTSSLFASAFGKPKAKEILSESNMKSYSLVKIKGETCALIKKYNFQATEIFYAEHFDDQAITIEMVNSFI